MPQNKNYSVKARTQTGGGGYLEGVRLRTRKRGSTVLECLRTYHVDGPNIETWLVSESPKDTSHGFNDMKCFL